MLESLIQDPLIDALQEIEEQNGMEFWSIPQRGSRRGAHALLHYPAMMVPALQGTILRSICDIDEETSKVLDPFVGSGTILVESMQQGLDFCGVDINPLAGLVCLAKSGPYYIGAFEEKRHFLVEAIRADKKKYKPREFPGRDKWFESSASVSLEKICQHIRREPSLWMRRLFWLGLCSVVRLTSNSRMSTYKLHKKPDAELNLKTDPITIFKKILESFSLNLQYQHTALKNAGLISRGHYQGKLEIEIADNKILQSRKYAKQEFDIVMTSPPYGDNQTTIPYGQFAYLPLHWVDIADIHSNIDPSLLSNTHATDSASLGGSRRNVKEKTEKLTDASPTAHVFVSQLGSNADGIKRFSSFFYDLMESVDRVSDRTRQGGYHVWTIGNRRIGGKVVPMDELMTDFLQNRDIDVLGKIHRRIHSKKMASRNKSTETMTTETIVIGKKRFVE